MIATLPTLKNWKKKKKEKNTGLEPVFLLLTNFHLKNMISSYTKDSSWEKKEPNLPDVKELFFKKSPDFNHNVE